MADKQAIHGWVIVDKPVGITSRAAGAKLQRFLQARKYGHAGTLDPFASGVLPLAFGEATKTIPYLMEREKKYDFTMRLGEKRDTGDCTGKIVASCRNRPDDQKIQSIIPNYIGEIWQAPHPFSAIKIQGRRACDLMRAGQNIALPPRQVKILALRLTHRADQDHVCFSLTCKSGVYVRSLVEDMARDLGAYAYVSVLRRVQVGSFTEKQTILLEKPVTMRDTHFALHDEALPYNISLPIAILPIDVVLEDWQKLDINDEAGAKIQNGQNVAWDKLQAEGEQKIAGNEALLRRVCVFRAGKILALGKYQQGQFCPNRVFRFE